MQPFDAPLFSRPSVRPSPLGGGETDALTLWSVWSVRSPCSQLYDFSRVYMSASASVRLGPAPKKTDGPRRTLSVK